MHNVFLNIFIWKLNTMSNFNKKTHHCNSCNEVDVNKFYEGQKNLCKDCISKKNKSKHIRRVLIEKFYVKKHHCEICSEEDENKFYGQKNLCKDCISDRNKIKYENMNQEEIELYIAYQKEWRLEHLFQSRALQARARAKKKKISFNIDCDMLEKLWIKQNGLCFYSGMRMEKTKSGIYAVSLDRIDSELGYEENNIVLCAHIINSMKNALKVDEFYNIISTIYKYKQQLNVHSSSSAIFK